jgi:hypothetical protein
LAEGTSLVSDVELLIFTEPDIEQVPIEDALN